MALGPWDQAFRFQEAVMEKKKKKGSCDGKEQGIGFMEAAARRSFASSFSFLSFHVFPRMMSYMNTPYLHADMFQTTF